MAIKKPSAFDAFFAAADGGNAAQAQQAFAQAGGQVNLDPNNFKGQTQQAFNQGGLSDFFKAADAAATGNQVGLTDVLNNPNQNAVARINQQGQSFSGSDGTPPPPPPINPGMSQGDFDAFRNRNAGQDAQTAAPVTTATPQPIAPVLPDLDPGVAAQQRARAQQILDSMQASTTPGDSTNVDLFISNLGFGTDPRIRDEFAAKFRQAISNREQSQLAQQQAAANIQAGGTNAINTQDPTASLVNNGASFTEGIPLQATEITGPNANRSSGINTAITGLVGDLAGMDLPSNDQLRGNQLASVLEMINQADRAGQEAVTGLSLPDITASSVPARTLSALEQATEQRALDRLTGGRFIDPNSALTDSSERVVLERLRGGDNPVLQQLRERNAAAFDENRAQDIAELNRFGVLRGGDNIEAMLDLRERQRLADLDVDALGFQMQDNALAQALGFQSRRDNLGLAEQDLQRAAISDAAGLSNTRNALDLNEAQMTGNLRGAATLPARMAQAGLQFDAANLQQNVADRVLARNLTATSPTQREVFEEGVRQNQFGEGLARNADTRAGQALESDLFGEVQQGANRAPRQTLTGRGFEDNLSTSDLQRLLATNQDTRAGEAQDRTFGDSRIAQLLSAAEAGFISREEAESALAVALGFQGPTPGFTHQVDNTNVQTATGFSPEMGQEVQRASGFDPIESQNVSRTGTLTPAQIELLQQGTLGTLLNNPPTQQEMSGFSPETTRVGDDGILRFEFDDEVIRDPKAPRLSDDEETDIVNRIPDNDIFGGEITTPDGIAGMIERIRVELNNPALDPAERTRLQGTLSLLRILEGNAEGIS